MKKYRCQCGQSYFSQKGVVDCEKSHVGTPPEDNIIKAIRAALGVLNDENEPLVKLVQQLAAEVIYSRRTLAMIDDELQSIRRRVEQLNLYSS